MMVRTVDTPEEFWELMCKIGAVRTGQRSLAIEGTLYVTERSPEEVPGFIEAIVDELVEWSAPRPSLIARLLAWIQAKRLIRRTSAPRTR